MQIKTYLFLVLFSLLSSVSYSHAQTALVAGSTNSEEQTTKLPDDLTKEQARDLVSKLSDEDVRSILLQRLDAVAEKQAEERGDQVSLFTYLSDAFYDVGNSFVQAVETVPLVLSAAGKGIHLIGTSQGFIGVALFLGGLGLAIAAGLAVAKILDLVTTSARERLATAETLTLGTTIQILGKRLFLDLIKIVAFVVVSHLTLRLLYGASPTFLLSWALIFFILTPTLLMASISRFNLAPKRPELRLLNMGNKQAIRTHRYSVIGALLIGIFIFFMSAQQAMNIEMGKYRVGFWLNLIIHGFFIYSLYRIRHGMTKALIGKDGLVGPIGAKMAHWWPGIAMALSLLSWLVAEAIAGAGRFDLIDEGENYWTLLIIAFVPAFDTALRGMVSRLTPPPIGEGLIAEKAHRETLSSLVRAGRVLLVGLLLLALANIWDFSLVDTESKDFGTRLVSSIIDGLLVFIVGYLIWELVGLYFNRRLAREHGDAGFDLDSDEPGGGEGGGTGLSRLATVLPMVKFASQGLILVMTLLLGLSRLGLDITPLLAGAGIVGLAIGFGAQTLVKDIVSGIFFLADDAFRVGEYLVIGTTVGTVERISIRSLQLRHHTGPVHTIPYGEIPQVTNNSRDWVIMKLKFTFPFETDANRIKKIFKKIGAEMLEADYADDLIQTFKSQGVYDVDDVGIVIRGKFMAKPGTQWIIRKDVYNRVQKALDEAGIQFARKEVRVQIPGIDNNKELSPEQKEAVGAAVAEAAQEQLPDGAEKK